MDRFQPYDVDLDFQTDMPNTGVKTDQMSTRTSSQTSHQGLDHALFGPLHYEPNYCYPLIVWIHGPEDDERQLNQVMPHISLRNYVGISPRGTNLQTRYAEGVDSYSWEQTPSQIVTALDRVLDCVELASMRFNIAPDRVFLAGYEAGGTMAMRIAMSQPESFAGVASFNGGLPRNHTPFRNVENFRNLPLMLGFGRDGADYSAERLSNDLRLVHAAGMTSLNLRQYPCGDELVTQMLKDFDAWAMEIVTGTSMDTTTNTQPRFDNWN